MPETKDSFSGYYAVATFTVEMYTAEQERKAENLVGMALTLIRAIFFRRRGTGFEADRP